MTLAVIMLPRSKDEPHFPIMAVDLMEYNFLISYHIRLELSTSKESDGTTPLTGEKGGRA